MAGPLNALVAELIRGQKNKLPKINLGSNWTDSCESAFQVLKIALTNAPVLAYADFCKPFILDIGASRFGRRVVTGTWG